MILSEDRMTHFAHVIIDGIWEDDLVDYSDDDEAIRAGKRALVFFVKEIGDLDAQIRSKIQGMKKPAFEGTPEWDTMYTKFYQEEMRKRGDG